MSKNCLKLFTFTLLIFSNFLFAQQRNLWSRINESSINSSDIQRKVKLKKHETFALNIQEFGKELKSAPAREVLSGKSSFKMAFPDKNGNLVTFLIKQASVMHPDLAKQFPNNRSYVGVSQKDNSKRIRFSVNELGLYAIIMDVNGGVQYIEPLTKDKKNYKIYDRQDLESQQDFQCLTENIQGNFQKESAFKVADDGKLRTYRLALAGTWEYSDYHINEQGVGNGTDAEKKAVVLAAMTVAVTRINALYENDLAISLQLVAENADLIFLDPDDPYDNFDALAMLGQNQTTCDNVIGSGSYDIGHVFSTGSDGVATGSVVCVNGAKARGVTGSPIPEGDNFYYDVVAHEMGHQFGANHTFNGDDGSCGFPNQRIPATAVETGSGSTIMAYAGYCSSQNVQANSDVYFHIISIEEISNYIINGSGANCAVETDLVFNNNAPVANAGPDFIIPKGTPYKLVGQGSDADGDPISYCWEQVDNGITVVPPSATATSGALYRSQIPVTDNERYLPHLNTLVTGSISSTWEVTPEVAREINFTLTVRDNNSEAGQVVSDDLKVTVTDAAGPFLVTSQNTSDVVWTPGTQETISWDVAGTDGNGINVSSVNILLSTDEGKTFSTLRANVPNDGTQIITVPDSKASLCYIMVEAIGNHFFSMNTQSFSIGEFNKVCNSYVADDTPVAIPDNDETGVLSVIAVSENVSVENIKVRLINDSNPSIETPGITHTYLGDLIISLESPQGTVIELLVNKCDAREDIQAVFSDEGIELTACNSSSPGITGIIKPSQEFTGFNGENSQGNWTLKVVDDGAVDTGFLESWSLEICSSEAVLGVNNYVFDDFNVYPNPSNGDFKVTFRSDDTGDVDIVVYDLLGRKIVDQTYKNQLNSFEQNMNLGELAGGIYILSVKRANKMSSHKIRIK